MDLKGMIDSGAAKTGSQTELAQFLGIPRDHLTHSKAGRRGLPIYACVKLAQLIGEEPTRVIAASELVTEKKEERRAFWLPFVSAIANDATTSIANTAKALTRGHSLN